MARTAHCPTCDTNVKVPDGARRGAFVRCPSCDETFQPPFLKPIQAVDEDDEPYDPHTSVRYGVKRSHGRNASNDAERERKRKVREEREAEPAWEKPRRGLFDGPDAVWLMLTVFGLILTFAVWYGLKSRNAPEVGASRASFLVSALLVVVAVGSIVSAILYLYNRPFRKL